MKIYGGHDFYDSILGYGADPSVVLFRKNQELEDTICLPRAVWLRLNGHYRDFAHITVAFCSKVYHGVELGGQYFWSADKLRAWVDGKEPKKVINVVGAYQWHQKTQYELEQYFSVEDSPQYLKDYMIAHRYAILLEMERSYKRVVIMNPHGLQKIDFAKALDPYTAYQELSMWVGGVLAGESPKTVKITSDKVLIEGHGFDNITSFRGPRIK